MKNKKLFIIGSIIVFVLLISGLSYAYLSINVKNNKTYTFKSGCLNITINNVDKNNLEINNAVPVSDIEGLESKGYKFTITNACDNPTNYKISLEKVTINNGIEDQYIRASIRSDNFDYIIKTLDNTKTETELYKGTLGKRETKEYELKEWIEYNTTFEQAGGKSYQNKIKVEANPEITPNESDIKINIEDRSATITTEKEVNDLTYCIGRINQCENYETQLETKELTLTDEGKKIICIKDNNNESICNIGGNYYGEGTETNPYQIQYIEDLVTLSNKTNNGDTYEGEWFKLTRDLDFKENTSYKDHTRTDYGNINGDENKDNLKTELTSGTGFKPIGNKNDNADESTAFQGIFNGSGFILNNLYQNTSWDKYTGLFGRIYNATIKNLTLKGELKVAKIDSGAVIGSAKGTSTIENVINYVNASSTIGSNSLSGIIGISSGEVTIKNCINYGNITNSNNAGGLVGIVTNISNTRIENSSNYGTITNNLGKHAGGLIGRDDGSESHTTIKNSYNKGDVKGSNPNTTTLIGGLMGFVHGKIEIENSYNTGNIKSSAKEDIIQYTGGLIGVSGPYTKIINSYNNGNVTGGNRVGGFIGQANIGSVLLINKCYNTGNIIGNTPFGSIYTAGFIGSVGWNGGDAYILNSYNLGNVSSLENNLGSTKAGGITGPNGSKDDNTFTKIITYNVYNAGDVEADTISYGILEIYKSSAEINNAYNIGNSKMYTLIQSDKNIEEDLKVSNAYYLTNTKASNQNINATALTENQFLNKEKYNNQLFTDILNNNIKNINLDTINSELKEAELIKDGEEITLSTWYTSSDGYPTLNNN